MIAENFLEGIKQFNQQEFYACHDTLESIWIKTIDLDKHFYQGILQISVGCYHLINNNWHGAVTLLGEGIRKLRKYQPNYKNVNVSQFLEESENLLTYLHGVSPDSITEISMLLKSDAKHSLCKLPYIIMLS
ncbi:DUF309 domain-containing protein [Candidatus Atelocyanobacterium thalassae]|jgi:predicted metal-dependent hydrolase|uniref:Uncharacterized conserved protein n=1 Tax=Atelocyanobacterium thalassa (isolate ALOHA) TaxID=1453429 RepID=D3ENK1_ATETH|nr:DUF309 domain-containing protein [Candidatus Atelocyanobacterium thalassa]ADB95051.1 uncharacterized conserved protein [Candidatus Atelocyanobacterium thalassa isolate ALOHA]MCH2543455.1 DUF309 domain-containing protein [Candidatus Atelocyanobacterium sp. ALOHA_A2.5_9]|tara:strand:- start:1321 stop:1716 length:396 start_codon:yes stop_codon:yes gene_type:complete